MSIVIIGILKEIVACIDIYTTIIIFFQLAETNTYLNCKRNRTIKVEYYEKLINQFIHFRTSNFLLKLQNNNFIKLKQLQKTRSYSIEMYKF